VTNTAVFLCTCKNGIQIDFKDVAKSLRKEGIRIIEITDLLCRPKGTAYIIQHLRWNDDRKPGRVIIGACPQEIRGNFFKTLLEEFGLEEDALKMVNLREHVGWVHNRKDATKIARVLMKDALELTDVKSGEVKVKGDVAIIGGGAERQRIERLISDLADVNVVGVHDAVIDMDVKGHVGDFMLTFVREKFIGEGCISCGECIGVCPEDAIVRMSSIPYYKIGPGCDSCGLCEKKCPVDAVVLGKEKTKIKASFVISFLDSRSKSKSESDADTIDLIDVNRARGIYDCYDKDPVVRYSRALSVLPEILSHAAGFTRPMPPKIDMDLCANKIILKRDTDRVDVKGCDRCIAACPSGAISRRMKIDMAACRNCTICSASCPTGAIQMDGYGDGRLMEKIESYLKADVHPRILIFSCLDFGLSVLDAVGAAKMEYPAVVPVFVPCIGRVDENLILRSFELGADGVAFLGCGHVECSFKDGFTKALDRVSFTGQILDALGIGRERVTSILTKTGAKNPERFIKEIEGFSNRLSGLRPRKAKRKPVDFEPDKRKMLIKILRNLKESETPALRVKGETLTFGKIDIEMAKCSACGSCFLHCTTGGLVREVARGREEGEDSESGITDIVVDSSCINCGICVSICPEKAIEVKGEFDLEGMIRAAECRVVHERVRCRGCGRPFITKKAFEKIEASIKKGVADDGLNNILRHLRYCPDCKFKVKVEP